jgi:hypothetical protein
MLHRRALPIAAVLLVSLDVHGVFGQTVPAAQPASDAAQPRRRTNAVFQGAETARHDTLALNSSLNAGYDDAVRGGAGQGDTFESSPGGWFTGLDLDLTYAPLARGRASFDFHGASSTRYYTAQSQLAAASQSVGAGTQVRLSRTTTFQARGGAAYTPYFDFTTLPEMEQPDPVQVPVRVRDNTLATRRVLTYDGGADVTHAPSDRTSMTLRYAARRTELLDEARNSFDTTISGAFSRRLGRRLSTHVTYSHRDGENLVEDVQEPIRVDDLEVGLDRQWARSPTRRTMVSFLVGPSVIRQHNERFVRAFGGASLAHGFARSWNVRALYRRGITFVEGNAQPFLSQTATVGLSGLLTRHLDTTLSAGAVLGDIGFEGTPTAYDTFSGTAQARYAINRSFAMYGEYVYNYSKYSSGANGPGINRSGFRAGLTAYWPIVQERAVARRAR